MCIPWRAPWLLLLTHHPSPFAHNTLPYAPLTQHLTPSGTRQLPGGKGLPSCSCCVCATAVMAPLLLHDQVLQGLQPLRHGLLLFLGLLLALQRQIQLAHHTLHLQKGGRRSVPTQRVQQVWDVSRPLLGGSYSYILQKSNSCTLKDSKRHPGFCTMKFN